MLRYLNELNKMLVFQNEMDGSSTTLTLQVREEEEVIDLTYLLLFLLEGDREASFRIFDPEKSQYVQLPPNKQLPKRFFLSPIVMFKYRVTKEGSGSLLVEHKQRCQERTIKEVILSVKRWRKQRIRSGTGQPKVSLDEAARRVGLPKKSLDDYFGQLRLGQLYGFDFLTNLDNRFGVLRNFVRNHKKMPKVAPGKKMRYPKILKILTHYKDDEEAAQQQHLFTKQIKEQIDKPLVLPVLESAIEQVSSANPMFDQQQDENQFYRCYEMMLNEPKDPFVPFNPRDFKQLKNWKEQENREFQQW